MERVLHIQKVLLRSGRLPWIIVGVTLVILGGIILLASLQLRKQIRGQIAGRDGEILYAVAMMQQFEEDLDPSLVGSIADPANQMLVILKTSRLKGVLAARRFDTGGRFAEAFPPNVREAALAPADLPLLKSLNPVSHFHAQLRMADLFYPEKPQVKGTTTPSVPILEVNVPLHAEGDSRLAGIAQFLLSGHGIATEFAALDRHLLLQGLAAFLAGGAILVLTVGLAFRHLRQAHQLVQERTNNLLRANQELALSAKTSALGAVTAHLIHGLKNPLSGLQNYVSSLGENETAHIESDWRQAVASTRRMQNLINEVVAVLREEEGASQYEVTLSELTELLATRVEPHCRETGVRLITRVQGQGALSSRVANLLILLLLNLVHNALEATPKGKTVLLLVTRTETDFAFEVRDEGPGLPVERAKNVFQPCRSTKEGGSGLGLAISKQLANHLQANLELKSTGPEGSVFTLTLPLKACLENADSAIPVPG